MPRQGLTAALALTLCALAAPTAARAQAQDITADPTSLLWGRQFTEWFYGAEVDSLYVRMDSRAQERVGGTEGLLQFLSRVQTQGGTEEEVFSEEVKADSTGVYRYTRRVRFSNLPDMVIRVGWALSPEKKIVGFGMGPENEGGN